MASLEEIALEWGLDITTPEMQQRIKEDKERTAKIEHAKSKRPELVQRVNALGYHLTRSGHQWFVGRNRDTRRSITFKEWVNAVPEFHPTNRLLTTEELEAALARLQSE